MTAGRNTIVAAALAAAAAGLGFACGSGATHKKPTSSLPPAGSPSDDGTGLLARWSVASPEAGADLSLGTGAANLGYGGSSYGGDVYGMYGGSLYGGRQGGATYGGSLYANYRFNMNQVTPTPYPPPAVAGVAPVYTPDYTVTHAGTVEGTVRWPKPPKAVEKLPARDGCSQELDNDTLVLGKDGRVANAVVFIESINKGRAAHTPIGGILERVDCAFRPHVQVMSPAGSSALRLTSSDEGAHTFRVTPRESDKGASALELEVKRRGETARGAVPTAGTYRVDTASDAGAARAWVIVPTHPYYAITDEDGGFRLDGVPPGSYTLVVWHEPVIVGFTADGAPKLTKAFETKKKIKVTAKKASSISISLPSGR